MLGWRDIWVVSRFAFTHPSIEIVLGLVFTCLLIWPRKVMDGSLYFFYLFRDKAVHDLLLERMFGRYGLGFSLAELARATDRSEGSVCRSLRRLEYDHKAKHNSNGWYGYKP